MYLYQLTSRQMAAVQWLTDERNTVRGDDPMITAQDMLDSLVATFPDIQARLAFAIEQAKV